MPVRISVALCTYNGGAFLRQQLDSIAAQTRPPCEVVVFDDGSTDDTLDILNGFTAAPLRLHRNVERVGPAQNFGRAIAACVGDVIACCDQDDVWRADKLAVLGKQFDRRADLGLAFSDAEATDADDRPMGYRLWDAVGFTPRLRRAFAADPFDVLVRQNVVTGATMAFAARLRPLVLPIPPGWMHDGWIALLVAAVADTCTVRDPLVRYRQHQTQAVGAERRSWRRQLRTAREMPRSAFADQAAAYRAARERLSPWPGVDPARLALLNAKVAHCQTRSAIRLRQRPRLPASVGELLSLRYARFSLGWKSFAQDLLL